jgi:hypothetical protein
LSRARHLAISAHGISASRDTQSEEAFEPAQREYDEACEILKLWHPVKTTEVALQQRKLFNGFVLEALDGKFDFKASYESIGEAAQPVPAAMRLDLELPTNQMISRCPNALTLVSPPSVETLWGHGIKFSEALPAIYTKEVL